MGRSENFKQYAADCMRQAEGQQSPEDRAILLNVALAWVRLAQQTQLAAVPAPGDKSGPPSPKKSEAAPLPAA